MKVTIFLRKGMAAPSILLIEAFYTGSHKQLIDLLHKEVPETHLVTLPGKKWHWKARTSALWLSQALPREHSFKTLFTSSVLNLAELIALRPDLASLHKVVYFHENQLVYPVRKQQDRDFQFGYNQILTSMVADVVLFNSRHNMDSFFNNINSHLKLIPDHRPKCLAEQIRPKCHVLHFPIVFPSPAELLEPEEMIEDRKKQKLDEIDKNERECLDECLDITETSSNELAGRSNEITGSSFTKVVIGESFEEDSGRLNKNVDGNTDEEKDFIVAEKDISDSDKSSEVEINDTVTKICRSEHRTDGTFLKDLPYKKFKSMENSSPLHIVWPHRWEHDKDPETFFKVLIQLHKDGLDFRVSVLGETYTEVPDIFEKSKDVLKGKILHWGFLPSKQQYYTVLKSADCVVSTAKHEFFGVAMLEAVHLGCFPLCPNRLVYPEIFPKECLYNTEQQLFKKLKEFSKKPYIVRHKKIPVDTCQYTWDLLKKQFVTFLMCS